MSLHRTRVGSSDPVWITEDKVGFSSRLRSSRCRFRAPAMREIIIAVSNLMLDQEMDEVVYSCIYFTFSR